jgi:hypothetical protein
MVVWVLIAIFWVGLLLLILHDATASDTGGSAIVAASKRWKRIFKRMKSWADKVGSALRKLIAAWKARRIRAAKPASTSPTATVTLSVATARTDGSTAPAATAKSDPSTPSAALAQEDPSSPVVSPRINPATTAKKRPAGAVKNKWWSKDRRASITSSELELTIAEAVRKTSPKCEELVGVIVHHRRPKIQHDPNWAVRGVKFGKADRKMVDEALATVVEQLQREFRLTEP